MSRTTKIRITALLNGDSVSTLGIAYAVNTLDPYSLFLQKAGSYYLQGLDLTFTRAFLEDGTEIFSPLLIPHDSRVYFSCGENFISPMDVQPRSDGEDDLDLIPELFNDYEEEEDEKEKEKEKERKVGENDNFSLTAISTSPLASSAPQEPSIYPDYQQQEEHPSPYGQLHLKLIAHQQQQQQQQQDIGSTTCITSTYAQLRATQSTTSTSTIASTSTSTTTTTSTSTSTSTIATTIPPVPDPLLVEPLTTSTGESIDQSTARIIHAFRSAIIATQDNYTELFSSVSKQGMSYWSSAQTFLADTTRWVASQYSRVMQSPTVSAIQQNTGRAVHIVGVGADSVKDFVEAHPEIPVLFVKAAASIGMTVVLLKVGSRGNAVHIATSVAIPTAIALGSLFVPSQDSLMKFSSDVRVIVSLFLNPATRPILLQMMKAKWESIPSASPFGGGSDQSQAGAGPTAGSGDGTSSSAALMQTAAPATPLPPPSASASAGTPQRQVYPINMDVD